MTRHSRKHSKIVIRPGGNAVAAGGNVQRLRAPAQIRVASGSMAESIKLVWGGIASVLEPALSSALTFAFFSSGRSHWAGFIYNDECAAQINFGRDDLQPDQISQAQHQTLGMARCLSLVVDLELAAIFRLCFWHVPGHQPGVLVLLLFVPEFRRADGPEVVV